MQTLKELYVSKHLLYDEYEFSLVERNDLKD